MCIVVLLMFVDISICEFSKIVSFEDINLLVMVLIKEYFIINLIKIGVL